MRRRRNRTSRRWPRRDGWRHCRWSLWRRDRSYRRRNRRTLCCNRGRSNNSGCNWSWRGCCRSRGLWRYRRSRLGFLRRRGGGLRRRSRCRRSSRLLLIKNGLQHVSRLGDMRQVNLGFDFIGAGMRGARRLPRAVPVPRAFEVCTNLFSFVLFERAGMRLLLGDADFSQHIENGFAFDFQFSGQIVNSNLTHPPLCSSELCPAKSSYQPHGKFPMFQGFTFQGFITNLRETLKP